MTQHELQRRWDDAARKGDDAELITLVCNDVIDFPRESMDAHLTPFATIRELVGPPPMLFGRQYWRNRLIERVALEIVQHRAFVVRLAKMVRR